MSVTVRGVLERVRAGGSESPPETLTYLGLLLERDALGRYGDPIYEQLRFPPGWLELKLDQGEVDEIVEVLADVIDRYPALASTAAFALGKAYSDRAVPRLVAGLVRYWQHQDEAAYQLLIALDNHGLEQAQEFVARIAREGLPKSKEFARELRQRKGSAG